MPGPCSLPQGGKADYARFWETVCDFHTNSDFTCTPDHRKVDKDGEELNHKWLLRREWLFKRNRLTTGKTR